MPQRDFQGVGWHFNWNSILPGELRFWCSLEKICFTRGEVLELIDFLDEVAEDMAEYTEKVKG